ncbi:hypothetical protein MHBO_004487 [Bonamia ostreae]|uniref:Ribosomal protein L14 n=1 Tax=Bonamia ostreae TaxID=126728 RepID=A0ABV2ATG7_9EUKA
MFALTKSRCRSLPFRSFLVKMASRTVVTMRCGTADNSGAVLVRVIGNIGRRANKNPKIGDICTVTVREALNSKDSKVKRKDVVWAVLATSKKNFRRKDGSHIRSYRNSFVLIDKERKPIANRILYPVARELKKYKFVGDKAEVLI